MNYVDGFGNYNLEVGGAEGSKFENKSVLNLYFLDSGNQADCCLDRPEKDMIFTSIHRYILVAMIGSNSLNNLGSYRPLKGFRY